MPKFDHYVGVDYSGAKTATSPLSGLRMFLAEGAEDPIEVRPASTMHWTRHGIANWLCQRLLQDRLTLVGIDHGLSFPMEYFVRHDLALDWRAFLDDFRRHWPTDEGAVTVEQLRQGRVGQAAARSGDAKWRRLTEQRSGGAKSVFHFDVPGSVAKSTHSGLPWLRRILQKCPGSVHFWPFDGWDVASGRSMIAEVYPSLWRDRYPRREPSDDQHDAAVVARWLQDVDRNGSLEDFFHPSLKGDEQVRASVEGWILGVL